jgi:hypothetical protein
MKTNVRLPMEKKMPADKPEVHSAADILKSIDELVGVHRSGAMDVSADVSRAIRAFEEATCESNADAIAFLSMSTRFMQLVAVDLAEGRAPEPEAVAACDRYMGTAIAFLKMADIRDRVRNERDGTCH